MNDFWATMDRLFGDSRLFGGLYAKIKPLCLKYRELIVYIIVGGITTVIAWGCKFLWNIVVFGSPALPTLTQNSILSLVENVSGILCAYPLNRKWVFRSQNPRIFSEFLSFVGSRVATWVMGWLLNLLMVNALHISVYISTIVVGVLVIIGNYVFSKLLVFRKKKDEPSEEASDEPSEER